MKKTSSLFWIIDRNKLKPAHKQMEPVLAELAFRYALDVLLLAETEILDTKRLLNRLEETTKETFQKVPIRCKKVKAFVRQKPGKLPRFSCIT